MPSAMVNGLSLAYEVIGEGRPWAITPGGRFTKESLRRELEAAGLRVLEVEEALGGVGLSAVAEKPS